MFFLQCRWVSNTELIRKPDRFGLAISFYELVVHLSVYICMCFRRVYVYVCVCGVQLGTPMTNLAACHMRQSFLWLGDLDCNWGWMQLSAIFGAHSTTHTHTHTRTCILIYTNWNTHTYRHTHTHWHSQHSCLATFLSCFFLFDAKMRVN